MQSIDPFKEKIIEAVMTAKIEEIIRNKYLRIKSLSERFGAAQINKILSYIFLEIQVSSGIEKVIDDPKAINLIITTWMNNNQDKDIREFGIICNDGITGHYGPNYNKIAVETLGIWTKEYNLIKIPIILQNTDKHNRINQTQKITAPPPQDYKPIPVPEYIAKSTDDLVKTYKVDLTPSNTPRRLAALTHLLRNR
jgi:hypothetical protein